MIFPHSGEAIIPWLIRYALVLLNLLEDVPKNSIKSIVE